MIDFETIYEQRFSTSQLQPKPLEILFDSFFSSNRDPFRYGANAIICGFFNAQLRYHRRSFAVTRSQTSATQGRKRAGTKIERPHPKCVTRTPSTAR